MRLLDLFCGAGGVALGYHRAGFDEIVGVDNVHQPRYPFEFVQADALEYVAEHGHEFDAIHASPPCQGYSIMHNLPWLRGREYARLIKPTRDLMIHVGKPWVLENVMGAKWGCKNLENISRLIGYDITDHGMKANWLCGAMFGKPFYRHRLFESNWFWLAPGHPKHQGAIRRGRMLKDRASKIVTIPTRSGNFDPYWRENQVAILPIGKSPIQRYDGSTRTKVREGLNIRPGYEKVPFAYPTLTNWQNGADGVGIGHAKGWRLAAEAMGIDWMKRDELTQAIPPVFTEFIGTRLLEVSKEQ